MISLIEVQNRPLQKTIGSIINGYSSRLNILPRKWIPITNSFRMSVRLVVTLPNFKEVKQRPSAKMEQILIPNTCVLIEIQNGVQRAIQIPMSQYLAFPWGPAFLYRLVRWSQGLKWCKGHCNCNKDISMLELFFDFATYTGSLCPICLTPKSKRKETKDGKRHSCWELPDLSIEADMKGQLPLAEHSKVFGRAMEFLIKNGNPFGWPVETIPKTKSLCFIGLSTAARGFACRPKLLCDDSIGKLRDYLCTPTGMRRDLKSPLQLDKAPMEVPEQFQVKYQDRIPYLYRTFQHYVVWVWIILNLFAS